MAKKKMDKAALINAIKVSLSNIGFYDDLSENDSDDELGDKVEEIMMEAESVVSDCKRILDIVGYQND
jgi:hypothetical protein